MEREIASSEKKHVDLKSDTGFHNVLYDMISSQLNKVLQKSLKNSEYRKHLCVLGFKRTTISNLNRQNVDLKEFYFVSKKLFTPNKFDQLIKEYPRFNESEIFKKIKTLHKEAPSFYRILLDNNKLSFDILIKSQSDISDISDSSTSTLSPPPPNPCKSRIINCVKTFDIHSISNNRSSNTNLPTPNASKSQKISCIKSFDIHSISNYSDKLLNTNTDKSKDSSK